MKDEIRLTVIHELGHHFGLSDAEDLAGAACDHRAVPSGYGAGEKETATNGILKGRRSAAKAFHLKSAPPSNVISRRRIRYCGSLDPNFGNGWSASA